MNEAMRVADARGEPLILIEGNPRYYERFGFARADEVGIEPPAGVDQQYFMIRPLAAYDPALRGRAVYPRGVRERRANGAAPTEARRTRCGRRGRGPARALSARRSRAARTAARRSFRRLYQCMDDSPSASERRFLPLRYAP